jgi:hypothetical protein
MAVSQLAYMGIGVSDMANGVLSTLNLDMPVIDLNSLRQMVQAPRRPVSVPSREGPAAGS